MAAQRRLAYGAVAIAAAGFAACLAGWLAGGGSVDLPWAPTLGLRLDLSFDGLELYYGPQAQRAFPQQPV